MSCIFVLSCFGFVLFLFTLCSVLSLLACLVLHLRISLSIVHDFVSCLVFSCFVFLAYEVTVA
jgi:hypothetical protein